jgi:hypothetical protein
MLVKRTYQILNKIVCLVCDNPELAQAFHIDYQSFEIKKTDPDDCHIHISQKGTYLAINNKELDISGHPRPVHYACQVIVSEIMAQLHDFYLIHAGVVKKENILIMLAGPPGIGKSTLTQKLVENGFSFFSDDCAPLHKNSGLIHPFPRSMWIVGDSEKNISISVRSKKAIPACQFYSHNIPEKPGMVICLTDKSSKNHIIKLNLSLKNTNNPLLNDLKKIEKIHIHHRHPQYAEYQICYESSVSTTETIKQLCAEHKKHLWQIYRINITQPSFDCQSSITDISAHQAAAYMIPEMKMFDTFLSSPKKESALQSMLTICKHFKESSCFDMTPGTLNSAYHCILSAFNHFIDGKK